ncbi:HAMP domain-containing histidine kinase [Algibacter amylolyticus]|uniref:histidine kinase n=1 Tax=Algibacter amylolyticus TaxID=1608400 RepID=A0A5M7AZF4_9FLAO|nr:HAMP domain-containing sensor histidine kinase [Algibacter amylolyticus]KAA5821438.1 HAMP domain-containing histidine kinase [Algibacter amylolyticus]MBB5268313.1 signal transduction histidine kinase [Algibacter amylolyticus]TSJ72950.1 HAMP domain-containing histidine kinase [Algibacter amylolyticus]
MLSNILNIGINSTLNPDWIKRVRIVNMMSLITFSISISFIIYGVLFSWPNLIILVVVIPFITSSTTLILNFKRLFKIAIINYIASNFIMVFTTAILLGSKLHYQYFLVSLIGLPLIFIKGDNKNLRTILSLLPIVLWIYLEFHFTKFEPVFYLPEHYNYLIRVINDFLMFVVVFCMFYVFTKESNTHLKELEDKTLKLTESNAKLEQFSYIVSHDLKAPLTNIDSLISIIEDDYFKDFNEDGRHIFSMIKESSIRMNALVTSILEYSRAGEGNIRVTTFNTADIFKDIPLLINIPENIQFKYPSVTHTITGSYSQLEQVLINLVNNAVKYHDKDQGTIKITVASLNADFLKFGVIDDGPGIKPEFHDVIFEMFGTANEESRLDSSGLGLSIVKKIVSLNHGEIGIESTYGSGSCFWFTWPLKVIGK